MTARNCHSWTDRSREGSAVAGLVTALTLGVAFGGLALDLPGWWIAFPVGFGAVLPLAVALTAGRGGGDRRTVDGPDRRGREGGEPRDDEGDDRALDALRERYARGEIDEAEFERRVEGLLATEGRR